MVASSITGLYVAIKNNVDIESILEKMHMGDISSEDQVESNPLDEFAGEKEKKRNRMAKLAASSGGDLAFAVLCNEALFPIRVPITVALRPSPINTILV